MKKLICAKDVELASNEERKVIYIDSNTIITPSAKDIAKANGVEFSTETPICQMGNIVSGRKIDENPGAKGIDSEMVYSVFKVLMEKGLLQGVLESMAEIKKYQAEYHNGIKLVRGSSVKLDKLDDSSSNIYCQELITTGDSSMSAGMLIIDQSKFDKQLVYEEINYVIEGNLIVNLDGKKLIAYPGDVLYIPSGSMVTRSSSDKAKLLYVTYPG